MPSLKRAILGEDGGKGNILDLAVSVASISKPANTVQRLSGVFPFCNDRTTPGRAFFAAHPQTELTTNSVVPLLLIADSTSSFVFKSLKPDSVSSNSVSYTHLRAHET